MLNKHVLVMLVLAGLSASNVMAEDAELKPLEASLALGVTVNDGNTDNSMLNLGFGLTKQPSDTQVLRLEADAAYGETSGSNSTENAKASLDYQYLVSERAYASFNTSIAYDDISGLDYRWIVAPGAGYYLMKEDHVFMTVEAGPAYVMEKKDGESDDFVALRLAERYERTMDSSAKFWQLLEYLPDVEDVDIYVLTAEIGVEAPVSEKLNIQLVVKNTYDSNPADGREKNDLSVIGALAYSVF